MYSFWREASTCRPQIAEGASSRATVETVRIQAAHPTRLAANSSPAANALDPANQETNRSMCGASKNAQKWDFIAMAKSCRWWISQLAIDAASPHVRASNPV